MIRRHTTLIHVQTCLELLQRSAEFNIRHWAFSLYSSQHYDCLSKREKYLREFTSSSPKKKKQNNKINITSFIVDVHYWNCSISLLFTGLYCRSISAKMGEEQLLLWKQYCSVLVIKSQGITSFCQHFQFFNGLRKKQKHPAHKKGVFSPKMCCLCSHFMSINFTFFQLFVPRFSAASDLYLR